MRKAARKRRSRRHVSEPAQQAQAPVPTTSWVAVRTLVASTALTGLLPVPALAHPAFARPVAADRLAEWPAFAAADDGFTFQAPGAGRTDAQPSGPVTRFEIAGGPLSEVVAAFEHTSGVQVTLADSAFGAIWSPGVADQLTAAQALRALLSGTNLSFHFTSPTTAVIELARLAEAVDVVGASTAIVSSPKYTQPLRDTPQTLVVIPQAVLQDQGAVTLRDALRNTPGITLTAGEGGTAPGDNLLIRGFSARNDVYIDGARDPGVVSRDTFNVEAVEVAKGPSSVTAGRGATGGSVNLVTKTAHQENAAQLRLTGGNADQKRGTIDVNRRLSDTVAFRLNGVWQDSGVPRRDVVEQKEWGIAPSLAFGLGRPTIFRLGYQRLDQDNMPDYGLPGTLPELANAAGTTVDDLDFSNFYGLEARDHERVTSDIATATVEHRFADGSRVRNLTRYGRNSLDRVVTPPRAATAANAGSDPGFDPSVAQIRRTDTKYQYRDDRTLNNQTDLNTTFATGAVEHTMAAGIELARDRQPSHSATDRYTHGRPPVTSLFDPDPTQLYAPDIVETGAKSEATAFSTGIYAFDTLKFSDRIQADLGLRWDRIDVDYTTTSAARETADFGRIDRALSGRAGLVYKPATRGSIYGAYSTSFNPSFDGNFGLTLGATGANSAALPPERTRNFEVGTKWDVTRGLFATLALFRTEKTNAKTTDAATGAIVLAGDQQVNGIELGVSGQLTRRWGVFAGLSLMDAHIDESLVSAEVDRRLSYVPEQSFNIWSTYQLLSGTSVGAGAQFTGGYFFNNTNALTSENAAAIQRLTRYWLFNAMASHRLNPHLELQVNITNLANERYVDRGYSGHFIPGPGRSIVVGPVLTF
jgi:catecholate siderophore receptor